MQETRTVEETARTGQAPVLAQGRMRALAARIPYARQLWAALHPGPVPRPRGCEPFTPVIWSRQYAQGDWRELPQERVRYQVVSAAVARTVWPGDTILDVGCGTGTLLPYLWPLPYLRYLGLDHSREAIRQAKAVCVDRWRASFVVAEILTYAPSRLFDCMVWNEVLYYLAAPLAVLERYAQWLAPDGAVVVSLCQAEAKSVALTQQLQQDAAWGVESVQRVQQVVGERVCTWDCLVLRRGKEAR